MTAFVAEADISRQRLYEHHADLVAEFKTTTGGGADSSEVQALQHQLASAHVRIQQLEIETKVLQEPVRTFAAVITGLTQQAQTGNVVALPRRRHGRGER